MQTSFLTEQNTNSWEGCSPMIKRETDIQIMFTRLEILLGNPDDVPSLFDPFRIIVKNHIYHCTFKKSNTKYSRFYLKIKLY